MRPGHRAAYDAQGALREYWDSTAQRRGSLIGMDTLETHSTEVEHRKVSEPAIFSFAGFTFGQI